MTLTLKRTALASAPAQGTLKPKPAPQKNRSPEPKLPHNLSRKPYNTLPRQTPKSFPKDRRQTPKSFPKDRHIWCSGKVTQPQLFIS